MNAGLPDTHPSIRFYDSDYPGRDTTAFPENFDAVTSYQGLAHDVDRYRELAREAGGEVLELCCGTGRVAVPLARDGHAVCAVDLSAAMLERLRERLAAEPPDVRARVTLERQDVTRLDLGGRRFRLIVLAFNSLMCIPDFRGQMATLRAVAAHLDEGGVAAIDLVNPCVLPLAGDPVPKPFLTRRSEISGARYTRFAALGPFDAEQRQRLFGWYDEIGEDGTIRRTPYEMTWRPIFRWELELMLEASGLRALSVEGGHRREEFTAQSAKMFVVAGRV